jgi:hypothetical protein
LSFLEQPTFSDRRGSSTTAAGGQTNGVSFQQSFEQSQWDQPQGYMPPQQSFNQQTIAQQHVYAAMPHEHDGQVHQLDSSVSLSGMVDPFEALVQQRSNNP